MVRGEIKRVGCYGAKYSYYVKLIKRLKRCKRGIIKGS